MLTKLENRIRALENVKKSETEEMIFHVVFVAPRLSEPNETLEGKLDKYPPVAQQIAEQRTAGVKNFLVFSNEKYGEYPTGIKERKNG